MATASESQGRGIDPKVATGLPPAADADDADKGRYTVSRFAAQNDHFIGFFKTWTKTLNFLIGEQWRSRWDGTGLTWLTARDVPEWRQQPVTNFVFAVYRAAMAKLTKQKPTLEVVPPSGNSEDQEAAELCSALLTYLWRYLKKPSKFPAAIGWILVTGMAYIRVGYDPEGGELKPRTVPVPRKKQPLGDGAIANAMAGGAEPDSGDGEVPDDMEEVEVACDEDGMPYRTPAGAIDYERKPDMERLGEIDWSIVSPLAVRLNPEATSHEDATEMYVGTLTAKNKAAKRFGVAEEDLGTADESAEQIALYDNLVNATAAGFPRSWQDQRSGYGVSQETAIGARVLVIEYYSKPDDQYPQGRHWITAGMRKVWPPMSAEQAKAAMQRQIAPEGTEDEDGSDTPIFENGEAPLPFGFWPPLIPILDTVIPGQPTAISLLSQVVPLNEQLNTLDGKIAEKHTMDSMGGIWFISPEDKGMQITSEPAQVITSVAMGRRGAAFAPFQAQMHAMAEPVYREREIINQKIQIISGMSGPDLSQKPEGVPSGRSLLVTQETSDSVLMPLLFAMEAGLEESGRRELIIAQQKYREERVIKIRQTDGKYIYRSFRNADLRDGHDVRVEVGSSFPWSKSAQLDAKMDLVKAVPGLYTDMATMKVDPIKLARILDSGAPGLEAFESDENPDLIEIEREHQMFENFDPTTPDGSHQLPQIAFWQNSPIHLQEHYNFMKKSFTRYQQWHPAAQEAFKTHMMLTQAAVEDAAARLMPPPAAPPGPNGEENAPPGGGPPAPGGPPPLSLVRPGEPPPGARLTPADRASATP